MILCMLVVMLPTCMHPIHTPVHRHPIHVPYPRERGPTRNICPPHTLGSIPCYGLKYTHVCTRVAALEYACAIGMVTSANHVRSIAFFVLKCGMLGWGKLKRTPHKWCQSNFSVYIYIYMLSVIPCLPVFYFNDLQYLVNVYVL